MANNQPTSLPVWNTSAANRTTPPGGKQTSGYTFGENPSSAYDNWFNNLVYQWTLYAQLPTATGANVAAFLAQSLDTSAVALLGGGGNALTADLNAAMTKFPGAGVLGAQIASNLAATAGFANMTAPNLGAGVAGASTNGAGVAGIGGTTTLAVLLAAVATGNTPGVVGQSTSLAGVLGRTVTAGVPAVMGEGTVSGGGIGGAFSANNYTRANLQTDMTTYAGSAVLGVTGNASQAGVVGKNAGGTGVLGTDTGAGVGVKGTSTSGVGGQFSGNTSRGNMNLPARQPAPTSVSTTVGVGDAWMDLFGTPYTTSSTTNPGLKIWDGMYWTPTYSLAYGGSTVGTVTVSSTAQFWNPGFLNINANSARPNSIIRARGQISVPANNALTYSLIFQLFGTNYAVTFAGTASTQTVNFDFSLVVLGDNASVFTQASCILQVGATLTFVYPTGSISIANLIANSSAKIGLSCSGSPTGTASLPQMQWEANL